MRDSWFAYPVCICVTRYTLQIRVYRTHNNNYINYPISYARNTLSLTNGERSPFDRYNDRKAVMRRFFKMTDFKEPIFSLFYLVLS